MNHGGHGGTRRIRRTYIESPPGEDGLLRGMARRVPTAGWEPALHSQACQLNDVPERGGDQHSAQGGHDEQAVPGLQQIG